MSTTEGLEAAVTAALAAAVAWQREAKEALWRLPSHRQVEATIRAQYERAEAAEAALAAVREYRVMVNEDGDADLLGPCAWTIGCLFHVTHDGIDGVTLGTLIDAAAEHEGEQGERAHARLAEINGSDEEARDG